MTDNTSMRTGALYIRVSTGKQEELSPDAQRRLLLDYASKNNIIISNQYIYEEDGISGRKADKRPQFQDMIAHAKSKEHPFDVILVWKYSRFARNQEESIVYKSMLRKDHVEVISVSEPLVDGPFGSLIERIIEWMDEYYSIRLSGEVVRGMTENALRGRNQARPPLGYKVPHAKETPVIVPEEALIIHTIFDMYTEDGASMFAIAKRLNDLGYLTSHKKPFERRSIGYILSNPTYIGKSVWNRHSNDNKALKDESEWIIRDGSHEPIISTEQYEKAQQRIKAEYTPKYAKPPELHRHWLSGMVKCHTCGRSLSTSIHKDKRYGRTYTNFQCYGYLKGKCNVSHQISARKLEPAVLEGLQEIMEGVRPLQFKIIKSEEPATQSAHEILTDRLHDIEKKEERIRQAYRDGIDTIEEYRDNKAILFKERAEIESRLEELTPAPVPSETDTRELMRNRLKNVYEILSSEDVSTVTKSNALKSIVDKIVYDSEKKELSIYLYCSDTL